MFTYCLNAPVNCIDPSGFYGAAALRNTRDGFVRESGGAGVGGDALASLLTFVSISWFTISSKEETKNNVVAITTTMSEDSSAVYYPADIIGSKTSPKKWKQYPFPMGHDTAVGWVISTALSGKYGRNASWGLYTVNQDDALEMATSLGGPMPCQHEGRVGEHPHYHVVAMDLFGYYKHFHIWYGEENVS